MKLRLPFIVGYTLGLILLGWALFAGNSEFLIYAVVTVALVALLHWSDSYYQYRTWVLWLFDIWIVLHILGGLYEVSDGVVLYSLVLIDIVGEPYLILKYDQLVHAYCYFVIALLLARVLRRSSPAEMSFGLFAMITVLAATGVGALNEVVEFIAVVTVPDTNVGGYENTVIDIIANLIGAMLAMPFFPRD